MGRTHPTLKLTTMLRHLILLVAFQAGFDKANGADCPYDYENLNWGGLATSNPTECDGAELCKSGSDQLKGSPINIVKANTVAASCQLNFFEDLSFQMAYTSLSGKWAQKGFTFQFTVDDVPNRPTVQYTSDFTKSNHNYELLQVHYHWGDSTTKGSEHFIDGTQYPLEVHFVHGNTKYKKDSSWGANPDGLLVIGVLYKIYNSGTDVFDQTKWLNDQANRAEAWAEASNPQETSSNDQSNMWNTLKTALENGHYNYKGSLTTPLCNEAVTWIVAKTVLPVLSSDIDKFRKLKAPRGPKEGQGITRNWREPQAIGTRTVYEMSRSWDYGSWAWYYGIMS